MLKPSQGIEGIEDFIVDTARRAGGNPCPPVVLGVGIGSRFGTRFQRQAGIAGGVILMLIGIKILLEHLGVL